MNDETITIGWLREQISGLEIRPIVAADYDLRLVRDRNYVEKARVLDGVLLDEVWEIVDRAAALGQIRQREDA